MKNTIDECLEKTKPSKRCFKVSKKEFSGQRQCVTNLWPELNDLLPPNWQQTVDEINLRYPEDIYSTLYLGIQIDDEEIMKPTYAGVSALYSGQYTDSHGTIRYHNDASSRVVDHMNDLQKQITIKINQDADDQIISFDDRFKLRWYDDSQKIIKYIRTSPGEGRMTLELSAYLMLCGTKEKKCYNKKEPQIVSSHDVQGYVYYFEDDEGWYVGSAGDLTERWDTRRQLHQLASYCDLARIYAGLRVMYLDFCICKRSAAPILERILIQHLETMENSDISNESLINPAYRGGKYRQLGIQFKKCDQDKKYQFIPTPVEDILDF